MADSNSIDRSSAYADVLILLDSCITQACPDSTHSANSNSSGDDWVPAPEYKAEVELSEVNVLNVPVANSSTDGFNHISGTTIEPEYEVHGLSLLIEEIIDDNDSKKSSHFDKSIPHHEYHQQVEVESSCGNSEPSMKVKSETDAENKLIEFNDLNISFFGEMPKKPKNSLQEAFLHFRKKRQDEIKAERRRRDAVLQANADPKRMEALRTRIIAQAKKYYGTPYAKKYWDPSTPEYHSPMFLDCCGLVRQVIRDLEPELGFRLGPWNQSYMFDTLPVTLKKEQMKPGDLVFMKGIYTSTRTKKQRHNMTHVEIWLGDGDKTIGSRWNSGKVGEFESYKFYPKSFHSEEYIFKSIDTWLMGICHSFCSKHPWRVAKYNPTCKSIFSVANEKEIKDEKAEPDSEDDDEIKDYGDDDIDDEIKNNNENVNSIVDPSMIALKPKVGTMTPVDISGGLTPRSAINGSPCSNPDASGGRSSRSKSNKTQGITKKVKPAQDAYVIDTDVRKTGPLKNKFKQQDLARLASQALKRRNKSKQEELVSNCVTPTPIPIVGSVNAEELNYIPTNMPSRINTASSSCNWIPTKDRDRKMKKERESAFLHPNQKTATWSLHHSEKNPIFSIVGSKDPSIPKTSSCPNLEQSDVNLLFRANTSFFETPKDVNNNKTTKQTQNASNRKKEIPNNKIVKEVNRAEIKDRKSKKLNLMVGGGEQGVEDCLIVRKSPSFREEVKGKREESECREDNVTSISVLQQIRKRHSTNTFSQIQEEESLIAEASKSAKQSIQHSDLNSVANSTIADGSGKKKSQVPTEIEREACITETEVKGRELQLQTVERELTRLSFSEEVIQDTARSINELENLEDVNTSLCSDFDLEEDEDGNLADKSENSYNINYSYIGKEMKEDKDNNEDNCCNLLDSGDNTDDELQSAIEMTVLNHRALDASTAMFVGEDNRHNPSWEWLHALKAGEMDNNDDTFFNIADSTIPYGATNEHYLLGNDYDLDTINNIRDLNRPNSFAYRKLNTLPPINSTPNDNNPRTTINQTYNNYEVLHHQQQCRENTVFQDNCSMDVMLPPTRQTGQRPSIQGVAGTGDGGTFHEGFQSHSHPKIENLLAHYVLSQQPRYSIDSASISGSCSISVDDDYTVNIPDANKSKNNNNINPTFLTNHSLFDTNTSASSYLSLSSEDTAMSLQQQNTFSRRHQRLTENDQREVTANDYNTTQYEEDTIQKQATLYIGTQDTASRSTTQEGHDNGNDRDDIHAENNNMSQGPSMIAKSVRCDKETLEVDTVKRSSSTVTTKSKAESIVQEGETIKGGDENSKTGNNNNNNGDDNDASKGKPAGGGDSGTSQGGTGGVGAGGGNGGGNGGGTGGGGGGGGGGGNRRPSGPRASKLPACSLPNNMQPTFYIGGGNGTALVETPLLNLGWKRITDKYDERYRLKWVECKSKINYAAFKEGEQLVNHIPNCKLLTNKLGLLSSLQEYERVTLLTKGRFPRMKMADFVPETYKLDERNDREKFLNEYKDGEVWICKPTGMNQGKGIFLLRSRAEIDQLLMERDAKNHQSKSGSRPPMMRIVQRYISNPLLLDSRKFDIRTYMLIASTVPYLLLYHKGYVRLSVVKYDNEDLNLTAHLTNQYIQKKDPSYKDVKEDSAWSMDKFNEYINDNFASQHGLETDWVYGNLTKQMQRIILHCFNGVKHKLQTKIGYFDLYGMDFMVDTDFKVWLIEINVNPALHINCEALKEVIPDIVEETLHLSIECFDKSRKGQPLMPLNSLRGFSVLHCGTSPNAVAPRQTRSVSPSKDGATEKNRPSGTAPSVRRASPPRNLPRMSIVNTQMVTSSQSTATATTATNSQASPYSSKKVSVSSTLPTINIGATVIQKKSSTAGSVVVGGGNSGTANSTTTTAASSSSNSGRQQQQQQQQSTHQQHSQPHQGVVPQKQPQVVPPTNQTLDIGGALLVGEDQQAKLRMTHAEPNKRKNKDYSSRGN